MHELLSRVHKDHARTGADPQALRLPPAQAEMRSVRVCLRKQAQSPQPSACAGLARWVGAAHKHARRGQRFFAVCYRSLLPRTVQHTDPRMWQLLRELNVRAAKEAMPAGWHLVPQPRPVPCLRLAQHALAHALMAHV